MLKQESGQEKSGVWCIVSSSVLVTNTHRLVFSSAVGHYSKSVFHGNLQRIQGLISDALLQVRRKERTEINLTATAGWKTKEIQCDCPSKHRMN